MAGAGWLVAQKDNVGSHFFSFPVFVYMRRPNHIFPEIYNTPIISELGFTVCLVQLELEYLLARDQKVLT